MSTEQFGAYWRLCCYAYLGLPGFDRGYLPCEPEQLAQLAGLSVKRWAKISASILSCFEKKTDGKMTQKRILATIKAQDIWREKSRIGGLKSSTRNFRRGKGGSPLVKPNEQPNGQPKGNIAHASSSSITSSRKDHARADVPRSKFSLEECRRFAASERGIKNPAAYATSIYRSGSADDLITAYLERPESMSGPLSDPTQEGVIARAAAQEGRPIEDVRAEFEATEKTIGGNGNRPGGKR